jgi:hypothetical protein
MKMLARLLPFGFLFLAAAGEAPTLAPVRDVTVTFKVTKAVNPGGPAKLVMQITKGGALARIDSYIFVDARTPYEGMIFNSKTGLAEVLLYARSMVFEAHPPNLAIPGVTLTPDMAFRRRGDRTIAGIPCSDWDVTPPGGEAWTACVTKDGVVLRTVSPKREMEAIAMKFEPLLASTFVPDKDLKRVVKAEPAK